MAAPRRPVRVRRVLGAVGDDLRALRAGSAPALRVLPGPALWARPDGKEHVAEVRERVREPLVELLVGPLQERLPVLGVEHVLDEPAGGGALPGRDVVVQRHLETVLAAVR